MKFKLIIALVNDNKTDKILKASREAGAKGATIINNARGEGIDSSKTFFGLSLEKHNELVLMLVEEHLSCTVLETIGKIGEFDNSAGNGIAFQIDVEDAVGVSHQIKTLTKEIEDQL